MMEERRKGKILMKLQIVFMALVKFMGRTKVNNDFLIKVRNTVLRGLVLDVCRICFCGFAIYIISQVRISEIIVHR